MEVPEMKNSRSEDQIEPMVVSPKQAQKMGGWGNTRFYADVLPKLDSFLDGRSRRITTASIKAYIARKLAGTYEPPFKRGSLPPIPAFSRVRRRTPPTGNPAA